MSQKDNSVTWPELPKQLHYALKTLCCLAPAEGPRRAREVARGTGIPPAEAEKILHLLVWGGFISSRRGAKGGFWLRRPPGRIRIGDVVKFLSSPLNAADKRRRDVVSRLWHQTADSSYEAFNRLSLEDLVKEMQGGELLRCQEDASTDLGNSSLNRLHEVSPVRGQTTAGDPHE